MGLGDLPISDVFVLAERVDGAPLVHILPMPNGPVGALLHGADEWLIVVNSHDTTLARQRFTCAHELGHYLFDRDRGPLHVDATLAQGESVPETRANAFAAHLLVPRTALDRRIKGGQTDLHDEAQVVALAFEYGISYVSLCWHLQNNGLIGRATRVRLLSDASPYRLAVRQGLRDKVDQETAAKNTTRYPRRFLSAALSARDASLVDDAWFAERNLSEVLRDDDHDELFDQEGFDFDDFDDSDGRA